MKTAIVAMLLATAIASPSYAVDPSQCCAVGSVRFRDLSKPNTSRPVMVGASNTDYYRNQSATVVIPRSSGRSCTTYKNYKTWVTECYSY